MLKVRKVTSNNKGSATVEMSIIMPIMIIAVFVVIVMFINLFDKETVRGKMYVSVYTLPVSDEYMLRTVTNNKEAISKDGLMTRVDINHEVSSGVFTYKADLNLYAVVAEAKNSEKCSKEYDLRINRLRRWQFYGNYIKEPGDE